MPSLQSQLSAQLSAAIDAVNPSAENIDPTVIAEFLKKNAEEKAAAKQKYVLIDVREPEEFAQLGHIVSSINVPHFDLVNDAAGLVKKALASSLGSSVDKSAEDAGDVTIVFISLASPDLDALSADQWIDSIASSSDDAADASFKKMGVRVLLGGFSSWAEQFGSDAVLTVQKK